MVIDGCNTISHLSAGVFELCRIGDDTSGTDWHRTRAYGINALAFRAPQQGAFYQADPDMVGLAKANAVPWDKNSQWLDLVARSGTTLFISWKADLFNDDIRSAVREAFKTAAKPRAVGKPVDWMETKVPTHWIFDGGEATYTW
jgi:alpha-galactosidase